MILPFLSRLQCTFSPSVSSWKCTVRLKTVEISVKFYTIFLIHLNRTSFVNNLADCLQSSFWAGIWVQNRHDCMVSNWQTDPTFTKRSADTFLESWQYTSLPTFLCFSDCRSCWRSFFHLLLLYIGGAADRKRCDFMFIKPPLLKLFVHITSFYIYLS